MSLNKWIYYAVGYVFIASGVIKLLDQSFIGNFLAMGMPFPEVSVYVVAIIELGCGMLILGRMYLQFASLLLLFIMAGAMVVAKFPILISGGFFTFLFEVRLNVVMIILLLLILRSVESRRPS